jgi:anti-anti-sigma factor
MGPVSGAAAAGEPRAGVGATVEGDFVVVALTGEIDVANVDVVARGLQRSVRGATTVVVDLSGVRYAGSAALRLLEAEGSRLAALDARCVLVAPAGPVRRLLAIVGLDQLLPVVASLAEARRQLAG